MRVSSDYCQDLPGRDLRPGLDVDLGDRAVVRRGHGVLHLHRLEHEDDVAGGDLRPGLDRDPDDRAGHRREQRAARDRVGGVGEARQQAQPLADRCCRCRGRPLRDSSTCTSKLIRWPLTISTTRSGAAETTVQSSLGWRKPSRAAYHSATTGSSRPGTSNEVRCGCDTTLRHPAGCRAGRGARRRRGRPPRSQRRTGPARCHPCVRRRWGGPRRAGARGSWWSWCRRPPRPRAAASRAGRGW